MLFVKGSLSTMVDRLTCYGEFSLMQDAWLYKTHLNFIRSNKKKTKY